MKSKMRIVHAFHHYYPVVGGLERAIAGLAEEQAKLGNQVHVIVSTYGAEGMPPEETLNKVYVKRLKALRLHYPDLTIPKAIPKEFLRKADIVHAHGHNSLFSMRILEEAFKLGVKTACYFMAVDAFYDHPNRIVRLLAPYYGIRNTKRASRIADLSLVKNMRDLEIIRRRYGIKAEYLPDALPEYYLVMKKRDGWAFREKFGIRHEKIFLFIGRMHSLKGPQILVKALKYLDKKVAAVFIGPDGGHLKETLALAERLGVKDRVYVLGFVDEGTKIWAIDSAIAIVLPSIADYVEVYPMVISEAWAREKPVIASRVGGIPYRIEQYLNGILVPPSDPKVLAEAMLKVANDEKIAEEMGKNGRREVFSWKEISIKSLKLYEKVFRDRIEG